MEEPEGFAAFVRASSRGLLQTGWLLTGDWALAQDLVQTALARTWPRFASVATDARLAYVRRVMTTTYLAWRSRRWTAEHPYADVPDAAAPDSFAAADLHDALRQALATLSPRQRATVVLRYFLDLTKTETAAAMGCSVGTVKTQHSRALAALRGLPELIDLKDGTP